MAVQTSDDGTRNVEIMVPLKCISNLWRTLEMPLISCEINLILTGSVNSVLLPNASANQVTTFAITETKLCLPVVTLLTKDNAKLVK